MIENDAVLPVPELGALEREAAERGVGLRELVKERMGARARVLEMRRKDALRYGYEPDVWLVARALLGRERLPAVVNRVLAERTGWDEGTCWERWSEGLRRRVGLGHAVRDLMILGANRSSKTDFAAKDSVEAGAAGGKRIMIASQKLDTSVLVQQARLWRYLPMEWRRNALGVAGPNEYVKYSEKNGFTGNGLITGDGTRYGFCFYTQKLTDVFEGSSLHHMWNDEEVGLDWLETERYRVADTGGSMVTTFTPVSGYTPAVGDYLEGMRVARWSWGYMLPRDGKDPAPWAAAGLGREEAERFERESRGKMPVTVPAGRCEDCVRWVTGEWGEIGDNAVPGRVWERVPRVAVCRDGTRAVVWFHGADNPYGNPLQVIAKAAMNKNARDEIRTRVYGIALKQAGKRFAGFDRKVHVVTA